MDLRSVSNGWVFAQGGAEGGDLLGHLFELGIPEMRLGRVEDAVECLRSVEGKYLRKSQPLLLFLFSSRTPRLLIRGYLRLVGRKRDVDLLHCLDPLGGQRVAHLFELLLRADCYVRNEMVRVSTQLCEQVLVKWGSSAFQSFCHSFTSSVTFGEEDVCEPVLRPVLRVEVAEQPPDALLAGRDEVDGLHGGQRLAVLVDGLDDGDALRREVLHLGARAHHLHRLLVHHQHAPLAPGLLVVRPRRVADHVVHNF